MILAKSLIETVKVSNDLKKSFVIIVANNQPLL